MTRLLSYTLVFIFGFTACALVIHRLPPYQGMPEERASLATYRGRSLPPAGDRYAVADAVSRVEPAVVNIYTVSRSSPRESWGDLWLRRWFGRPLPPREVGPVRGVASGVIVSPDGFILTNDHVVQDSDQISVTLPNKDRYDGEVLGTDPDDDLAIVKIDAHHLPTASMGDSSHLRIGEWVVAIGNPLGFGSSVTAGVVSAERRDPFTVEGKTLRHVIQTDAAINQGNSGGALINLSGELIGINTAIVSTSSAGGSIGIGFAIPIDDARPVVAELIRYGRVLRPWIGIKYMTVPDPTTPAEAPLLLPGGVDLPSAEHGRGILVDQVLPGSPAATAQLRKGDVIVRLDQTPVHSKEDVYLFMTRHTPGQRVRVLFQRAGHPLAVALRLGLKPRDAEQLVRQ